MVKFIVGPKGSGKTKWLIEKANEEKKKGNGNIVFIDVDDNHIFSLDYSVRLINAMEFNIKNIESFYGFLCGIIGMDYDVEKIYVDGIYKAFSLKAEELEKLNEMLSIIGEKFNTEFYIGSDLNMKEMPKKLQINCIELEVD
ncbi:hypothetical protein [Clostridium sp. Cult2]|uniref:hypothetical protein n=1 Tax=Clostridium sp. Cult2 TaxID=2079003 RepID=UPI001F30ECFE|nr:hypothetical protein [Clostridium sp. Cult2]MCF6465758.1 hypothetical protein [Clostridium sp. Cult2]